MPTYPSLYPAPWNESESGSSVATAAKRTDAALGGHAYMLDKLVEQRFQIHSIPLLRQQADQSDRPGDQSINPESFWRVFGDSWHFGAGQQHFDRKGSDPWRFRESMGLYVWQEGQISLLNAVDAKAISASANMKLAVAGDFLYIIAGTALSRTADVTPGTPTFTTITGTPGTAPTDIATDGFNVITCHGASGIYKTTRGAATTASHITGTVEILGFCKNRFLAANNNVLYDISSLVVGASGALPAAYFTHPNTDFQWVGFAEGDAAIYFAGYSGDKSLIYRAIIAEDGTALDPPVIAARLEDGEIVTSIYGYLGRFIAIGTNKGWRLAIAKDSGDLQVGARIDTPNPVLCFEGQEEFIWYGLTAPMSSPSGVTGLGRMSLKNFTDVGLLVPAFANDIMAYSTNNAVRSVVTFQDLRVFAIDQVGIFAEDPTTLEVEGWFTTGEITYNITEHKTALTIDAQHISGAGTHEVEISAEGGGFESIGELTPNQFPRSIGQTVARVFELRHTFRRDVVDPTLSPFLNSWMMFAQPQPGSTSKWIYATILLAPEVKDLNGVALDYDTWAELDFIDGLNDSREVTSWQAGERLWAVVLDDYIMDFHDVMSRPGFTGFNGSCLLKMKKV